MFRRFFARITEFLSEVKSELKKVSFPTRAETLGSTGVVLVLVLIVSIFLSLLDYFLVRLVRVVIG
jgi:preprotein translocase subunit SecE